MAISDPAYSLSSDEITFNEDGVYKVTVDFGYMEQSLSGGNGGTMEVQVQEDTGAGFTDISYARSGAVHLENMDRFGSTQTWIRSFDATDKIRIRVREDIGTQHLGMLAGGSRVTIERVN